MSRWPEAARQRVGAVARGLDTTAQLPHPPQHSMHWAVVDAALHNGAVHDLLQQHARLYPQDIQCLFDGQAFHAMSRQGPWLVDLRRLHSPLFAHWFDKGWGQAWGIFVGTQPQGIAEVKRHLKKLLTVWLEDNQDNADNEDRDPRATKSAKTRALYRFYDPRVLRSTLPFFSYAFTQGMYAKLVNIYLCEGVRLAQVQGGPAVGEVYAYRLPREHFFQALTGKAGVQVSTLNVAGHPLLAVQPPTYSHELHPEGPP